MTKASTRDQWGRRRTIDSAFDIFLPLVPRDLYELAACAATRFKAHACDSRFVAGEITNVRGRSFFVIVRFRPTRSRPSRVSHFLRWGTIPDENLLSFVEISENVPSEARERETSWGFLPRRDINRRITVAGSAVTRLKFYFVRESCKVSLYGYDLAIKNGIILRFQ